MIGNRKTFWFSTALVLATVLGSLWLGQRISPLTRVVGDSMAPTIHEGDIFQVSRSIPRQMRRGAIVIVKQPGELPVIKRIVGLPRERISFCLGEVFINGKMLYEPYIPRNQTTFSWKEDTLASGADEYVVLGDNRLVSQDSRDYGAVKWCQIIGVIDVNCVPARFLDRPRYRILAGAAEIGKAGRHTRLTSVPQAWLDRL